MIGQSILFSEMLPNSSWEDRFNTWYHEDHIPVRMALDGFEGAQRYRSMSDDNYLVIYDMTSMEALTTKDYEILKSNPSDETKWMLANVTNFTRYLGNEVGRHGNLAGAIEAPIIFTAMFNVPEDEKADFDAWMTDDHLPILMENKDWMAVRRFELSVADPVPFNRLTVHYLANDKVLSSPERKRARSTDWRNRLAEKDWFQAGQYKGFNSCSERYLAEVAREICTARISGNSA